MPTIRLVLRMILLTLVRKSELIEATWAEVDFENATWAIPKARMKGRNPHVVYLSRQAVDIFVALHMLQEWADMVDAWIDGRTHVPKLLSENVVVPVLSAAL